MVAITALIGGCTTTSSEVASQVEAEIAVSVEAQCNTPAVRLDSIRSERTKKAVALVDPYSTVRVPPGRYEISVACQNPLMEDRSACHFWGHPDEYPTYRMPLEAGVRYTFHCYESASGLSYDITQSVGDEPIVTGLRDKLAASLGPGYGHVGAIRRPVRRVTAEQIGAPDLLKAGATISVVGPLTNQQVRALLQLIEDRVSDTTAITGDQQFAVVQLGDPKRDACCTATVLLENKDGVWTNLGAITRSH